MLIGLTGKARSGKNYCADVMKKKFGFKQLAFADPLKALVRDLFDMTDEQVNGELKEQVDLRYGKSPRWLLQYVGTDMFRSLYPTIWVDHLLRRYKRAMENPESRIVVTDVRFPDEADAIRGVGGEVWKIVRIGDYRGAESGIKGHASETAMDEYKPDQYIAARSGWLADLTTQVETATERFIKEKSIAI